LVYPTGQAGGFLFLLYAPKIKRSAKAVAKKEILLPDKIWPASPGGQAGLPIESFY